MIRTEPTTPSPQPPPHTVAPLAEAALVAHAAPGLPVAVLEPPVGRPPRGSWPDDDYRGWAGL